MLQFFANDFFKARDALRWFAGPLEGGQPGPVSKTDLEDIRYVLECLQRHCASLNLEAAELKVRKTISLSYFRRKSKRHDLAVALREIDDRIDEQFKYTVLMHIPPGRAKFHSQIKTREDIEHSEHPWFDWPDTNPFTKAAYAAFPSAERDIREAQNCYATDNTTACVFHLMRAAEVALRALARDRRLTFPKKPLNEQDWKPILDGLATDIKQRDQAPRSSWRSPEVRRAQVMFYKEAMAEFLAFKDLWRNYVSHARRDAFYDEHQAYSAMIHVAAFMGKLAEKISEMKRQPEFWRK